MFTYVNRGTLLIAILIIGISSSDIYQKSSAINVYQCFLGICS